MRCKVRSHQAYIGVELVQTTSFYRDLAGALVLDWFVCVASVCLSLLAYQIIYNRVEDKVDVCNLIIHINDLCTSCCTNAHVSKCKIFEAEACIDGRLYINVTMFPEHWNNIILWAK